MSLVEKAPITCFTSYPERQGPEILPGLPRSAAEGGCVQEVHRRFDPPAVTMRDYFCTRLCLDELVENMKMPDQFGRHFVLTLGRRHSSTTLSHALTPPPTPCPIPPPSPTS